MPQPPVFKEIDPSQYRRHWLDVAYATQDERQKLDIWLPDEGEGPFPLIVFVHGGGWMMGNKRENTMPGIFKVMSQGYALACVQYRLAPAAHWPAPMQDVRAAIRFLRAHGDEYRLKTDKIAAWGNSAGGHLLNMAAALGGRPIMLGDELGCADRSDAIQCLVDLFSPSDFYQLDLCDWMTIEDLKSGSGDFAEFTDEQVALGRPHNVLLGYRAMDNPAATAYASPINFVTEDFPRALYLHGIPDKIVPFTQSVSMWRKVNSVCGEERAHIELFPEAGHGDPAMKTDEVMNRCLDFIDEVLWEGPRTRTPLPPDPRLID